MKKEMKEREMKNQKSYALIPVMIIAGLLALNMMSLIAVVGPMPVVA